MQRIVYPNAPNEIAMKLQVSHPVYCNFFTPHECKARWVEYLWGMEKKSLYTLLVHGSKRFGQALNGISLSWESELTMRLHLVAMTVVCIAAYFLEVSLFEWMVLFVLFGLVMSLELMNTAVEALCNYVQAEDHPAIKRTKDLAAGAVLVASVFAVAIAIILLGPKVWDLLQAA